MSALSSTSCSSDMRTATSVIFFRASAFFCRLTRISTAEQIAAQAVLTPEQPQPLIGKQQVPHSPHGQPRASCRAAPAPPAAATRVSRRRRNLSWELTRSRARHAALAALPRSSPHANYFPGASWTQGVGAVSPWSFLTAPGRLTEPIPAAQNAKVLSNGQKGAAHPPSNGGTEHTGCDPCQAANNLLR